MNREIETLYFDWICRIIDEQNACKYTKLLNYLFDREFTYGNISHDENRAMDGIRLRNRFAVSQNIPDDVMDEALYSKPCSILEMIVALCIRIEESIMASEYYGDRTAYWFWEMIFNMGLKNMSDDRYEPYNVENIVNRFIRRQYSPNGKGGLVTVYKPGIDLRNVEIWYQVMWYLAEFEE